MICLFFFGGGGDLMIVFFFFVCDFFGIMIFCYFSDSVFGYQGGVGVTKVSNVSTGSTCKV